MNPHSTDEQGRDAKRWHVCREYSCYEWSDGAVLYDTASGDTHQLTPMASRILDFLRNAPRSNEEIANCVLSSDKTAVDGTSLTKVDTILAHLVALGLIEPIQH